MRVRRISALLGSAALMVAVLAAPAAAKPDVAHAHGANAGGNGGQHGADAAAATSVDAAAAATVGTAAVTPTAAAPAAAPAAPDLPDTASDTAVAAVARSCEQAPAGRATCFALRRVHPDGKPVSSQRVSYSATQLQAAYGLTSFLGNGSNQTIAIVDAYDDPNAAADLAVYRQANSLPVCGSCLTIVNQDGNTSPLPKSDVGWGQEISLDLDMASAICPACKILLVEANDSYLTSLGTAVNTAARLGATVISNSYGGSDLPDSQYGNAYIHPGVPITASTGDNGFGVSFPASSVNVTAVGGTSLRATGTTRTETAWSGAGSGCSRYNAKPAWQTATTGCANRAVADVSAVADPNTGVNVYDTFASGTSGSGWMIFGGTSASAPIIAGVYALAGGAVGAGYPYAHASSSTLHDVLSGSNGRCRPSVLCTSGSGWDGPTGLGSPNGIGAF